MLSLPTVKRVRLAVFIVADLSDKFANKYFLSAMSLRSSVGNQHDRTCTSETFDLGRLPWLDFYGAWDTSARPSVVCRSFRG